MPQPSSCIRCGCPRPAHEHYRPATNCALCSCPRFQRWITPGDVWWTLCAAVGLYRRL